MKYYFLVLLSILNISSYATCKLKNDTFKIGWTAFKTPKKVGVSGTFNKQALGLVSHTASSIQELLKGASVEIDSNDVFTDNKARDGKIAKFFFSTMEVSKNIKADVSKVTDKLIMLKVSMNGRIVEVPMEYTLKGNSLEAKGTLDVLNFAMDKELKALNQACFAKHEGKTWSDVNISFQADFDC
ncbi:MAG: YceI family protein [Halobacteriovoraceae bacterium]|nr:YceI family protein [Halobacteriovoraceae bacterium]